MSKKSDRNRKAKSTRDDDSAATESLPESHLDAPKDIRTIVIKCNYFKNISPMYATSDVKAVIKYLDVVIGESQLISVIDDDTIPIEESFSIDIDVLDQKHLDVLASSPITITTVQCSGTKDNTYEKLEKVEDFKPPEDVDSLFSIYEAFTGEKPGISIKDVKPTKKKGKKEEAKKSSSKSLSSKTSTTSKKSKTSKTSTKSGSKQESVRVKSDIFGLSVIDMMPLFNGHNHFTEKLIIQPINSTCELKSTFKNAPCIFVEVSTKDGKPLLEIKNILHVTVESICNVPSLMHSDMESKVCVMLPLLDQASSPMLFLYPKVTNLPPLQETPKKWPGIDDICFNANTTKYYIDNSFVDVANKSKLNLQDVFTADNNRLEFNYMKRNILLQEGNRCLKAHIALHKKLVLEIFVAPKRKRTNSYEDPEVHQNKVRSVKSPPFIHLMAILDLAALLYPGVKKRRIAAPVMTFQSADANNAGLEDSFFMPKPVETSARPAKQSKDDTARKKKPEKKEKSSKKDQSSTTKSEDKNLASLLPPRPEEAPPPEPSLPVFNEEGKQCFIIVEIELLRPLIEKKNLEEMEVYMQQLQMETIQTSKTILSRQVAEDYYNQTVSEIIEMVNKKWIEFNKLMNSIPKPDYDSFLDFLQKSGSYHLFINSISTSASFLVSNKYECMESDFKNSKTFQNLASELFGDLISKMHRVLNTMVCHGMEPGTKDPVAISSDDFLFYAKEAAELKLYSLAERYYMERITSPKQTTNIADHWLDYAIYNLESGDTSKALECVKESIALDVSPSNKYSMILLAALISDTNENDAETCLVNLMVHQASWCEGWCFLYLFYQKCGRPDGMEVALDYAMKKFDEDLAIASNYFGSDDLAWPMRTVPNTIFFRTAVMLLKLRLFSYVELAIAEEVLVPKNYGYVNYLLAVIRYYKKDYDHALDHIEEAREHYGSDYGVSGLAGHILYAKGDLKAAHEEYSRVIEAYDRPDDIHMIYVNCADILDKMGDHQKARKLMLIACKYHQTPHTWYTAGKLYFKENDLLSAEECFNEANVKDNKLPQVWAYLALVNLKLSRSNEAEQCYQQAMKCQLDDEELKQQIVEGFKSRNI